jgi:AcrR family transcriptional regulator
MKQVEKSAAMQSRLLEGTLSCLTDLGYRGTSTTEICRRAGVSRGAQLHHFPTKSALVAAAVEQILQRRIEELRTLLGQLADRPPADDLSSIFEFLWRVYRSNAFYAWLELLVASRADPTLRALLKDIDRRFTDQAQRLCATFLGDAAPEEIAATTRLVLSVFDGLATHRILAEDDAEARGVLTLLGRLRRR